MRKNLNLKLSWYTPENWDKVIKDEYLPVLAVRDPKSFKGTPIHFPELAPKRNLTSTEFMEYLQKRISYWKILNSFDVLSHVASSKGVVLFTDTQEDQFRVVLRDYFQCFLDTEITEYEYGD